MVDTLNLIQRATREVFREYRLELDDSGDAFVDTGGGLCLVKFRDADGRGSLAVKTDGHETMTADGVAEELRKQLDRLGKSRTNH